MVARKKKEAEEKAEMQDLKKEADLRLAELRQKIKEQEGSDKLGEIYQVMGAVVDVKFQNVKAVSYTHLDVYKRQLHGVACRTSHYRRINLPPLRI